MITDVRSPTRKDVASFPFRAMDAEECVRGGAYPIAATIRSIEESTASYILFFDEEPGVIWGYKIYPLCNSVANVWMMTGTPVDTHKWEFIREIRRAMKTLDASFVSYHIMVLRDYVAARRLFALLGFSELPNDDLEFVLMEKKGRPIWVN